MRDSALDPLPIDSTLPGIVAALRSSPGLIVQAPPGTGKTTRVPRALHDAGFAAPGEILVLEPRRLACRMAAARVAAEFGEPLGRRVGFTIRHENLCGPETRIRFVTEGILSRRFVQDPCLDGVSAVVLDEFHERHIHTDLALACLRRLQKGKRPDLKLVVMSATIDPAPVADFLAAASILGCGGAAHEITIGYEDREEDRPLAEKVVRGATRLLEEPCPGDILVFLPGAAEIRMVSEALQGLAARAGLEICPLHGDLTSEAQDRAVQPAARPKLILTTNVAETSITIPGIAAVIDSGLARQAGYSAWSGLPVLSLVKVSRASATQRAGRAGRTRAGRVLRLYTRRDYDMRPERDVPEIMRADLAEAVLMLHGAGIRDLRSFSWFEPPPAAGLAAAEELLEQLGALDKSGGLTPIGRRMAGFPLHPRLARLVMEGERLGAPAEACLLAALISERDVRLDARSRLHARPPRSIRADNGPSDLLDRLEAFEKARKSGFARHRLQELGLDPRAVEAVDRAHRQLVRLVARKGSSSMAEDLEEALGIATLAAFPDRVAKRRAAGAREFLLASGGTARLAEDSVVQSAPLIVAVDAEVRTGAKGTRDGAGTLIRVAAAVEPEWLAGLFPDDIRSQAVFAWNEKAGRVDEVTRTMYRDLVLEETDRPAPRSEDASRMLFANARRQGPAAFRDGDRVQELQARTDLLARHFPGLGLPPVDEESILAACAECCRGRRSLAELGAVSLVRALLERLTARQRGLLERETPERLKLPGGRSVAVHYAPGRDPWIASLLQDFAGMKVTPAICGGRVPLTVHLLAPSRRPIQVTRDLAGFWERHYPALRRQLERRYPRHKWPD